ncbi:hypothetical protein AB0M20_13125 [Actinoplanes sp. NPDC051633]|uniref:hypothetical protein n=1 Tax=Actinoplanes sp. NPDC051633 TaxID=3155670 RepID=UPI0034304A9E
MRRLFVVLFLLAATGWSAGCSTDRTGSSAATPEPAATPSAAAASVAPGASAKPGAAAGAAPKDAICEQATRVSTQFAKTFADDIKALVDASSKADPAAADQVKKKTARDVENYAFALRDMAGHTEDPKVSKALGEMSKQVGALKGDVRELDEEKLAAIGGGLDKACGTD